MKLIRLPGIDPIERPHYIICSVNGPYKIICSKY